MKSTIRIVAFFCVVILIGCKDKHIQSITNKPENINIEAQPIQLKKDSSEENSKTEVNKLTHDQLYAIGETRRDSSARLYSDPSTLKKVYSEVIDEDTSIMTLRYKQNRIISVVKRIINKYNVKLYNTVFCFRKDNECISVDYWNSVEKNTYTYDMFWGTLIKYDGNYNKIDIDVSQKLQIIKSTKVSLDSIMQHFPEFKYSFNWK